MCTVPVKPAVCLSYSQRMSFIDPNVYKVEGYKYKQYIVKLTSINNFIKVYFLHCFVQRHVSTVVMSRYQVDYFLIKVKYTINNTIVIVTYEISYNI